MINDNHLSDNNDTRDLNIRGILQSLKFHCQSTSLLSLKLLWWTSGTATKVWVAWTGHDSNCWNSLAYSLPGHLTIRNLKASVWLASHLSQSLGSGLEFNKKKRGGDRNKDNICLPVLVFEFHSWTQNTRRTALLPIAPVPVNVTRQDTYLIIPLWHSQVLF